MTTVTPKRIVWMACLVVWSATSPSLATAADEPKLKLPTEVKGEPTAFIRVQAETDCTTVKWRVADPGLNLFPVDLLKDTKVAVVTAARPGRYRLTAVAAKGDVPTDIAEVIVVVGNPTPTPTPKPDDPVNPDVKPDPPKPPADLPFPGVTGLHVLIVIERGKGIPTNQYNAIFAQEVRNYLEAKCAKSTDGGPARRVWDQNDDGYADSKVFGDALKRANEKKTSIPWIMIGNGKDGYEGPVPASLSDMLTLLKKYGG